LIVSVICSIDAAVCCRLEAWPSVRLEKSALSLAICAEPAAIELLLWRTCRTIPTRLWFIVLSADRSWPVSSLPRTSISELRSPDATACATLTALAIGTVTERVSVAATTAARLVAMAARAIIRTVAPCAMSAASAPNCSIPSTWVRANASIAAR